MEYRDRGLKAKLNTSSLIVSSLIDKKGLEFMRRSMRWEAPSMPTAAYDPHLLSEQEMPPVIGKT